MEAVHHNSSDSDTNINLSPVQAQVIAALAQGRTVTAAAKDADVHRNTIYNWLNEPTFKTAAQEAESEYVAILSRKNEVRCRIAAKDLRQQGNGIKRDGQTSSARDHRPVVG